MKKASTNLSIEHVVAFVLVAIVIVLVGFGFATNSFGSVKETFEDWGNKMLILLNVREESDIEQDYIEKAGFSWAGKERKVILDNKEKRCIVELSEFGERYSLNFKKNSRLEKQGNIFRLYLGIWSAIKNFGEKEILDSYFKYNLQGWQWSPYGGEIWMPCSQSIVQGGSFDGEEPIQEIVVLLNKLASKNFLDGINLIKEKGRLVEGDWKDIDIEIKSDNQLKKIKEQLEEVCY